MDNCLSFLRSTPPSWPAILHQVIQCRLRLFNVSQIFNLNHLAFISNHFRNIAWIVPAVFRSALVDRAGIFFFTLTGFNLKKRAASQLYASIWRKPNFIIFYVLVNMRLKQLPHIDFGRGCRERAVAVFDAALSTLVTVFHVCSGFTLDDSGKVYHPP